MSLDGSDNSGLPGNGHSHLQFVATGENGPVPHSPQELFPVNERRQDNDSIIGAATRNFGSTSYNMDVDQRDDDGAAQREQRARIHATYRPPIIEPSPKRIRIQSPHKGQQDSSDSDSTTLSLREQAEMKTEKNNSKKKAHSEAKKSVDAAAGSLTNTTASDANTTNSKHGEGTHKMEETEEEKAADDEAEMAGKKKPVRALAPNQTEKMFRLLERLNIQPRNAEMQELMAKLRRNQGSVQVN